MRAFCQYHYLVYWHFEIAGLGNFLNRRPITKPYPRTQRIVAADELRDAFSDRVDVQHAAQTKSRRNMRGTASHTQLTVIPACQLRERQWCAVESRLSP